MAEREITYRDIIKLHDRGRFVVDNLEKEIEEADRELSFLTDASEVLGPDALLIKDIASLPPILVTRKTLAEFRLATAKELLRQLDIKGSPCRECRGSGNTSMFEYKFCETCNGSGIRR